MMKGVITAAYVIDQKSTWAVGPETTWKKKRTSLHTVLFDWLLVGSSTFHCLQLFFFWSCRIHSLLYTTVLHMHVYATGAAASAAISLCCVVTMRTSNNPSSFVCNLLCAKWHIAKCNTLHENVDTHTCADGGVIWNIWSGSLRARRYRFAHSLTDSHASVQCSCIAHTQAHTTNMRPINNKAHKQRRLALRAAIVKCTTHTTKTRGRRQRATSTHISRVCVWMQENIFQSTTNSHPPPRTNHIFEVFLVVFPENIEKIRFFPYFYDKRGR